jgi:Icc-related predicted phosphoesterase
MKILLTADLHYTLKQMDWLSSSVARFDLVVIAGDLLDIVSIVDIDTQILVVMKYLRRLQPETQLLVSSGNHDLDAETPDGENVARWMDRVRDLGVPTDGDSWEKDGILFTICPWWEGPASRARVAAQLERDASRSKDRWIWVYHAPPIATEVSWDGKHDYGDASLRDWIDQYQPDLVLSGHIHHAPFAKGGNWVDQIGKTWIINNGKQIGPVPTFAVIDTDANTAEWLSLAGRERIHFETNEKIEF